MIDIVYPYISSTAKWQELKYSIRSIKKHFGELGKIWIIGDYPEWLNEEFYYIPHVRTLGINLPKCYDAGSKMLTIINHPDISENFIYSSDDVYFLRDISSADINKPYCWGHFNEMNFIPHTKHEQLKWSTKLALEAYGFSDVISGETHLPRYFNKRKMQLIFDEFNPIENRLLTNTLYLNYYREQSEPTIVLKQSPGIGAFFYGYQEPTASHLPKSESELNKILDTHLVLNHNDAGLSKMLKTAIEARF